MNDFLLLNIIHFILTRHLLIARKTLVATNNVTAVPPERNYVVWPDLTRNIRFLRWFLRPIRHT